MPTSAEPTAAYDLATAILACAVAGVDDAPDGAGPVARSCVVWGEIAWDDCECGQLVVSIGRQLPSNGFPNEGAPTVTNSRCGPPIWMLNFTVSILRCVPIVDDQGHPPTCAAVDASARLAAIDAWAVRNAVSCCLTALQKEPQANGAMAITDWLIRDQLAVGPEGGCAGSELNLLVGIRNCFCSEPAS